MRPTAVGTPVDRADARSKVTGTACYTVDVVLPDLAHAVVVQSTVPTGRIVRIDAAAAERAPGVLGVLSHANTPSLAEVPTFPQGPAGQRRPPLQDDTVNFDGEHLAVVVADTLHHAAQAAALIDVAYDREEAVTTLEAGDELPPSGIFGEAPDSVRGDPEAALARAEVRLDATYTTPTEHHHPLEPGATVAAWDGGRLTLYDSTQWVSGVRDAVAMTLGMATDQVRVVSPFVGGAFGSKAMVWPHVVLAALAARHVGRPVKLVLSRAQMFTSLGYRSPTVQRLSLGARQDGTLTAIVHAVTQQTSVFEEFVAGAGYISRSLYACPNVAVRHRLVRVNAPTPTVMRAPGEAVGSFALESALDELAAQSGVDPVALRLRNFAEDEPQEGLAWSSNALRECYQVGAERFGWERRTPEPRSMREGRHLVGWGMASATYGVHSEAAAARVRICADGRILVASGTQDLGTGTYTTMVQVAADALGVPVERVTAALGDTDLPPAPHSGGSQTAASVGPAVWSAALDACSKVLALAEQGDSYAEILTRHGIEFVEGRGDARPGASASRFAMRSFGAHFAEVQVDPELGEVRLTRFCGVFGAGRILNPKTARSQMIGGIVGGTGMALTERTVTDRRLGRVVSPNLSGYAVPTHADIPWIDVCFIDEHDPHVNALGVKGIGEVAIVGVAAAIANAVHHATGRRIRDLPITPQTLL
jgi:xanthine dehydrogenase YagR molybdenum-binding subunit